MQDAEQLPSFSELSDAGGVRLPWVQKRRYFLDAECLLRDLGLPPSLGSE